MEKTKKPLFDFWTWAGIYVLLLLVLVGLNMLWCSFFGYCLIDDAKHVHGEAFSVLKWLGFPTK